MISFKDIELQDKELITSYTQNSPRRNCELSSSNLCSWRFLYNTKFAIMDGFLLLKFWANDELVYMMGRSCWPYTIRLPGPDIPGCGRE